ncbi:hypothetical protein SBOR_3260 [Sclerotinia borealis F-4128]|uniref:Heterokaryon incompatibility domain-containing protein n=1 Tax=Sclerotinia borealis (strain F-4128) TaxID=1432307 RepID=W9CK32_SCLBF|nr:hypothetical protein SBOR_3260 [Sclerotinia borealis F-4128]
MSVANPEDFHHEDLSESDSFRILILHPGKHKSPIRCDLIHTTLHECGSDIYDNYTALSYVWGNASDTTKIWINGFRFAVTVNLAMALNDLRETKRPLRLWADAVCINQTNISERSQQVSLMKGIYSGSQNTVIYLGPRTDLSARLFELMQPRKQENSNLEETALHAAQDILSRPWFTRVWVYQELVLSNRVFVQVGQMRVPWDSLCEVLLRHRGDSIPKEMPKKGFYSRKKLTFSFGDEMMFPKSKSFFSEKKSILPLKSSLRTGFPYQVQSDVNTQRYQLLWNMNQSRLKYHQSLWDGDPPAPLLDILESRRGSKASDLRDIIYGHLAVADIYSPSRTLPMQTGSPVLCTWNRTQYVPVVDYTKSADEVFTEAARFIACSTDPGGLREVLYYSATKASHTKRSSLPSWVPDWTLDKDSLQDPCWPFAYESSADDTYYGYLPVYPHVLSFYYFECMYKQEVVERTSQLNLVVNDVGDESLRQALQNSFCIRYSLRDCPEAFYTEKFANIYRTMCSLWEGLMAANMMTEPFNIHYFLDQCGRQLGEDADFDYDRIVSSDFFANVLSMSIKYGIIAKDLFGKMNFARFRSGRIGVVPLATKQGDVMLDFTVLGAPKGHEGLVLRPKEGYKNANYDWNIRAAIEGAPNRVVPILHCTFVGEGWVENSIWSSPLNLSPASKNLSNTSKTSIIAIH